MPTLTRRRYHERPDCWHIYFGDVNIGTIARVGLPHDRAPWEWICGFYPGSEPGEYRNGMAETFDRARAAFEQAWQVFLSKRTEADFQAWRDHRDRTAWKHAMRDAGCKLPTQVSSGQSRCFCGALIDVPGMAQHVDAAHRTMAHPS